MREEAFLEGRARRLREQLAHVERHLEDLRRRQRPAHFRKLSAAQPLLWTFSPPRPRNRQYGDWLH